jgi:hypothetical protein
MSFLLFTRKAVIYWCLAAASPWVVLGQANLVSQGGESAIAGIFAGDQVRPGVAINSGGGYLVWQDNSLTGNGLRIRSTRLDSSLSSAAGSDFAVSAVAYKKSKTTGDQEKPQVASLSDGGVVFVWQGGKVGAQQIYARFLGVDGLFLTKDVRVSSHTRNNQTDAQVATLADGNVVVVWTSLGQDSSLQGVFARLFTPTGHPLGNEFQVNQYVLNNQRNPVVTALANGGFAIAWISELQRDSATVDVYGRVFNAFGTPVVNEFLVNNAANSFCANPSVTASPQGGFAVAWSQKEGVVLAEPSNPSDPTGRNDPSFLPAIAAFPAVIKSTNSWDVFACFLDANGGVTTPAFRLNSYAYGDQFGPKISRLGDQYLAVWTSLSQPDASGSAIDPWEGVFGQVITSTGTLVGNADVHVNTTTVNRQVQPAVVSDGASRFLVVWSSLVADSNSAGYSTYDLFAQQYMLSGGQ